LPVRTFVARVVILVVSIYGLTNTYDACASKI
jgi:hypothetical protein